MNTTILQTRLSNLKPLQRTIEGVNQGFMFTRETGSRMEVRPLDQLSGCV